MNLKEIVAANVCQLRKTHNMTQAQLAENMDMSLDTIGRIERGTVAPSFKTLQALCKVFRVDVVEIFGSGTSTRLKADRAMLLREINGTLSRMSDKDLKQAKKLLEALT